MKKIVMILAMAATVSFGYAQDDNKSAGFERRQPDPEQMTKMLTERLGLNEEQTKDLTVLNKEYADVLRGPGMRGGRPGMGRPGAPEQFGGQRPPRFGQSQGDGQGMNKRPELTEEQREEMKARMEKMQERRAEYDKKVQEILTKEQYEKFQEMSPKPGFRPGGPGMHHGGPAMRPNQGNATPNK